MLRIAIIGIGWAGARHVGAIRELGRKITVDCIVDNDADFLKSKAEELGISRTYTNFQDALADTEIDAVSICLPHALHCPVALEAAAAGKHILCEKPIALTVEDATRMIDAAEKHGVKLYVAENLPYTPMSKFARKLVLSQVYTGELTFASFLAGFQAQQYGYPGRRAWLSTLELGGTGSWMLHGIHSMAQLRYILGDVETVYMQEHHASSFERTDLEGTMSGLFTMESGIHVSVVQTCETRSPHKGYVIYGDKGVARISSEGCEIHSSNSPDEPPRFFSYPDEALSDYAQEMEAFADYVAGTAVGPTTAENERRSLAIVQAGYESAKTGQPICLKERFGQL
ncbi:Gfo/Idh/MocA family protein [Candidatus Poribacteria bacterium]